MSEETPVGPYVYQPFGSATHTELRDRLYAVAGFGVEPHPKGLTKGEAEALCEFLRRNYHKLEW